MVQQNIKLSNGWMRVSEASDPNYPGVWIEILDDSLSQTISQVLVEQPPDDKARVLIWHDGQQDDYDEEIVL